MKKLLLLVTLILSIGISDSHAQFGGFGRGGGTKIKGKISGMVVDSISGVEVGFATISLRREGRKKVINGTLSEVDGSFEFENISPGKYEIEISFLGYETKTVNGIETTKKKPDYKAGDLFLVPSSYLLEAVEIKEKRALFENKVDRIVFNAEDDSSVAGGDATDVLRKVPNLSVDLNGNVSIRGSQNIRILINGKPSGMFSNNVADALKMFPADQIKRVEVITSPGAKYDGEGSGGIINIVTKKDNIEGVAGTLNASVGNRQNSFNANVNAGKGRFGSSINGSMFYMNPNDGTFFLDRTQTVGGTTNTLKQNGVTETSRLGFRGTASAFYDFNAYHAINTSLSANGFGFDTDGFAEANGSFGANGFSFRNETVGETLNSGFDWNTDYTMKFEDNDTRELVIAYQLSKGDQDTDNTILGSGSEEQFNRHVNIFNDGDNWENTVQVDYVHPLPNSLKLEIGAKAVLRDIASDSKYYNLANGGRELLGSISNVFDYDQDVMAGYGQLSFTLGKVNFITGMRYEQTQIGGATDDNASTAFENSYDNWLPNFTISRAFKNFRTLKLSYSQRIQRPSLFNINPFYNSSDLTNVVVGNPQLGPETTQQIELGYNLRVLGFNVFATGYYKYTDNIIEQILTVQDRVSINTFNNVGHNNSFGVNMFLNKNIKNFTVRLGGDVYSYDATGFVNGEMLNNKDLQYRIFTGGEYSITGTFKADFFGFFQSDQATLQGNTPAFSIFGIGLRKDIKNVSIGLRIIEPFAADKEFNSFQSGANYSQRSGFSIPFRSFGLNVRYKFGKVDFRERKSKIKNDDLKAGGQQQGQGGGQQGMGN